MLLLLLLAWSTRASAQSPSENAPTLPEATSSRGSEAETTPALPVIDLMLSGGVLMIPIGIFSLVVVAVGIERALALRKSRVVPQQLVYRLGELADSGAFDPRTAYQICGRYPSSAARVLRTMLVRVGRPHAEISEATAHAAQRECDQLSGPVRTLHLSAAVAPLLGLLGTVQGMIQSFFATANLPAGANKAQVLAEGIYIALVTTFAGLCVAIPAAVLAHLFEGKILRLLHQVETVTDALLPHLEKYEGKVRLDHRELERDPADEHGVGRAPAVVAKVVEPARGSHR